MSSGQVNSRHALRYRPGVRLSCVHRTRVSLSQAVSDTVNTRPAAPRWRAPTSRAHTGPGGSGSRSGPARRRCAGYILPSRLQMTTASVVLTCSACHWRPGRPNRSTCSHLPKLPCGELTRACRAWPPPCGPRNRAARLCQWRSPAEVKITIGYWCKRAGHRLFLEKICPDIGPPGAWLCF